jgi:hypothetical protein
MEQSDHILKQDGDAIDWLPDVTGMSLDELAATTDPTIKAAGERLVAEALRPPEVEVTTWYNG